ncbi:MAG: DUF1580 domain-containing protein [Phycisphaerae bacterium]
MLAYNQDKLIRLHDVPKLPWLPARRANTRLHFSTLYRWAITGQRGRKLRTERVGATLCTTETWLHEFFASPAAGTQPSHHLQESTIRTPRQRERAVANACRQLERMGVQP